MDGFINGSAHQGADRTATSCVVRNDSRPAIESLGSTEGRGNTSQDTIRNMAMPHSTVETHTPAPHYANNVKGFRFAKVYPRMVLNFEDGKAVVSFVAVTKCARR